MPRRNANARTRILPGDAVSLLPVAVFSLAEQEETGGPSETRTDCRGPATHRRRPTRQTSFRRSEASAIVPSARTLPGACATKGSAA